MVLPNYWHEVIERAEGPMKIRLILQPITAALFAIRSGRRDAREGRTPYIWALVWESANRRQMFLEGWKDVSRVFLLAIGIDLIYQTVVLHAFRPGEAIFLGLVLAIVPYLIFRELVNRLLRRRREGTGTAI